MQLVQVVHRAHAAHIQKIEYRLDIQTRQCEKRVLNGTFRPFGVPDYAKYIDTVEIGSNAGPETGVQVTVWAGDNPRKIVYSSSHIIIAYRGSEPVTNYETKGVDLISFIQKSV